MVGYDSAKNTPHENLVRTWDFEFRLPRIPPPQNENLVRTWDFEF